MTGLNFTKVVLATPTGTLAANNPTLAKKSASILYEVPCSTYELSTSDFSSLIWGTNFTYVATEDPVEITMAFERVPSFCWEPLKKKYWLQKCN